MLEFEAMKKWLGQGEIDIDLMLQVGVISVERVVSLCRYELTDSPWFMGKE